MSYTSLFYHLVFSTKNRTPWLTPDRLAKVCRYIGGIVRNLKGALLDANGAADHLHLIMMASPTVPISGVLQKVKGGSSEWIHETFPELQDFWWQDGYSAFTVSKSALPDVLTYVRNQIEHHRKMSFQDELIALLDRHGVEYDSQHVSR